jgi:hypothetical protein
VSNAQAGSDFEAIARSFFAQQDLFIGSDPLLELCTGSQE